MIKKSLPDQIESASLWNDYITLYKNVSIRRPIFFLLVLLLFTLLVYSVGLKNQILIGWDDGEYLTHSDITQSIPGAGKSIFSSFYLGMYQPLAILSFRISYNLWGDTAWLYIFTNILLHLANTILVYLLLKKWTANITIALIVAFLFALHPMHVEGVVWISTRSSLLYSLFFLIGLLQYQKYLGSSKLKDLFLTAIWFLLSLLSKSMAATFPLILLLVDYYHKRPWNKRIVLEKIPFLILSVIFGLVAISASESFGHITVLEQSYSLIDRIVLILYGISFYLLKLLMPVNLSAIYAFPEMTAQGFPGWVYGSLIALVIIAVIIWKVKENRRLIIFGLLFFLVHISMVLPLFWSRIFITADRYTYLPYVGLFLIIAWFLNRIIENKEVLSKSTWNLVRLTMVMIIILLSFQTYSRVKKWKDVPTLLGDVVEKRRSDHDMAHAYFYLGNYNDVQGRENEALRYYDLTLTRNPKYLLALNNRGILKGKKLNFQGAISDFTTAINFKPDYAEAWYNRGVAYYQSNQQDLACNDWNKSLQLDFIAARTVINQYCRNNTGPNFQPPSLIKAN